MSKLKSQFTFKTKDKPTQHLGCNIIWPPDGNTIRTSTTSTAKSLRTSRMKSLRLYITSRRLGRQRTVLQQVLCSDTAPHIVVEDLVKENEGMEGQRIIEWTLVGFEDEGVIVGRKEWCNWKEEETLGGGALQGQNNLSKITGATDL
ncbi:hypothetical protein PPACK8108_LOCUS6116 [Phakopsora pachyrhizi]|uniref:Uncharacterized protein n=1 Tax=Phakopsora pachyrhizi TaxID=170000 RepID=A0AAV0AS32_PHAPC|nr:hypothetical protein PPACK8108_LOCUS6116 [Phakopsora pachyrhizi]